MKITCKKCNGRLYLEGEEGCEPPCKCGVFAETKMEGGTFIPAQRHNKGKPQWSLVDFDSLEPMVKVLEFGAEKYSRDNWKNGLNDTEVLESLQRHIIALFNGEQNDQESGLPHIGHLMCNAMFYSYNQKKDKGT